MKKLRAFTLIEILVVIAIISILSGLLFPVFVRAKVKAKSLTCLDNLRQAGLGVTLYQGDYDDMYPSGVEGFVRENYVLICSPQDFQACANASNIEELLSPYAKTSQIFSCPLDMGLDVLDFIVRPSIQRPSSFRSTSSSYWFNEDLYLGHFSGTSLRNPSASLLSVDRSGAWHGSGKPMANAPINNDALVDLYRGYQYNILYCDLHVKNGTPHSVDQGRSALYGLQQWVENLNLP